MRKVEGVDTVRVSLKDGLTVLELRPDNKVTLAALRTVIRNNGFVSKDAEIVARGTPRGKDFEISGTGERITVASPLAEAGEGRWQFKALPR